NVPACEICSVVGKALSDVALRDNPVQDNAIATYDQSADTFEAKLCCCMLNRFIGPHRHNMSALRLQNACDLHDAHLSPDHPQLLPPYSRATHARGYPFGSSK